MSLLTCSHPDDKGVEIVGVAVMVGEIDPSNPEITWGDAYDVYHGELEDGKLSSYILLHPLCFISVFQEMARQEITTALQIVIATAGELREGLGIYEEV